MEAWCLNHWIAREVPWPHFLYFILFLIFLVVLHGLWDLSSLIRDQTWAPAVEAQSPNHWTTREFLVHDF